MSIKKHINKRVDDFDNQFKNLILEEKLDISSLEDLIMANLENYRDLLNTHVEELLSNNIDEKKLISKKNKNGIIKDSHYQTKENEN